VISNRLWLLPLWIRGPLRIAAAAIAVGVVVFVLYPMYVHRMGWPLAVLSVIALCTITTSATLYLQQPVRQRGLNALGGLDRSRSLAALAALRTGSVPADPDVLTAAIRYGALWEAYQRKVTRTQRVAQWSVPAVAITFGVVELFRLPLAFGGLLIGVGLLWVVLLVRRGRHRRRIRANLPVLRAAAGPDLEAAADEVADAALPPLRYRLTVAAIVVPVIAFMTIVYFVGRVTPDCYTVGAVMNLVYDNRQLGDPQNMTRGEPDLATYRDWSRKLHSYADQSSDPHIAPRLRRIAELSSQAVSEFAESRDALVGPHPDFDLGHQQKRFSATMQALFDEERAVGALCS
jgi:hypothetical protein